MSSTTVLTPTGTLGYGFGVEALRRGLSLNPAVIAVDAGSTDPGPHYLGSGETLVSSLAIKKELTQLIVAARSRGIPLIVGSAGGAGARAHVDQTAAIVREIAKEQALKFRLATIYADIPTERVKEALRRGEVDQFEASFALTEDLLDDTTALVAQMGHEPIIEALKEGADVVIAGRTCDDCAIAAYPIANGFDEALSLHMGKILECGAFSAEPFAMDVMLGTVDSSQFVLEPGSQRRIASLQSVSAHSLYEREDPFRQAGPGYELDLSGCRYTRLDGRRVAVRGATLKTTDYSVKLEGAKILGFRTICIAGIRCPTMISVFNKVIDETRAATLEYFDEPSLQLVFHAYGKNGVMGALEPKQNSQPSEIGLVIEAVSNDQKLSRAACHHASAFLLHLHYPGQMNPSGNLAFLYSPSEIDAGPAYGFSAYHLMKVDSPLELFPRHYEEL